MADKRVLIVYYSFTKQTWLQIKKFTDGLESAGVFVALERLEPVAPYEFPFGSYARLFTVMFKTFFKARMVIRPVGEQCYEDWDLIVLAGPTWSYHPCGPVLAFLDQYAEDVCSGKKVLPLISCRAYWRLHYHELRKPLQKCGAEVMEPIVFVHPGREPWRFIGLFLQLRGKIARFNTWMKRYYPGYGHNQEQRDQAFEYGRRVAAAICGEDASN